MADKPCILLHMHVLGGTESATFDDVAKLDVRPDLTVSPDTDIVVDVKATDGIEHHVTSDPAVAPDLHRQLPVGE